MGLDMWAYKVPKEARKSPFDFDRNNRDYDEFRYWRKHHDLHGWMENLYKEKGGTEEFNCIPLELTLEDLDKLENDLKEEKLPNTTGFFFGHNPPDEETKKEDLEFVERARNLIENGWCVYYDSWW